MVDRRPLVVNRLRLRPRTDKGIEVARLELVSVGRKRLEVGDAVPGRPDSEDVMKGKCGQHREPASGTAADHKTFGVDVASFGEVAGSSDTVLHVGDTPGAVKRLAVRTAVPGGAAVVDIDDSDSPAGPIENAELELAAGLGGRAAVGENQQRRRGPLHADMIGISRRVIEGMSHRITITGREGDRLGLDQVTDIDGQLASGMHDLASDLRAVEHDLDDLRFVAVTGTDIDDTVGGRLHRGDGGIRHRDGAAVDHQLVAGRQPDGGDRVLGCDRPALHAEHPARCRNLERTSDHRGEPGVGRHRTEIPPLVPIAAGVERAVRTPAGFDPGFSTVTELELDVAEGAVGERRNEQAGGIPRHVRMVPRDPDEAGAVGRQPR